MILVKAAMKLLGFAFGLDDIVAAHRCMENNEATGKLVVVS
jgi:hypothetical protein